MAKIDRPTDLVAQSMGGMVAMQTALKRPELISHLVLTVTSGGIDMRRFNQEDWWSQYLRDLPDAPRWFVDDRIDLSDQLHTIETPTLLIWSDSDPVSPLASGEFLPETLPNAELVMIKGAGHFLTRDQVDEVVPHTREFVLTEEIATSTRNTTVLGWTLRA